MPGPSGIESAAALQHQASATRVLIVSMYDDTVLIARAIAAGAKGYVTKRSLTHELITAIRRVHAGELYVQR